MDFSELKSKINHRLTVKLEKLRLRNDSVYPIPKDIDRVWQNIY